MRQKVFLGIIVLLALILRLYKLGEVPPSLYWDEASLGYNAYSIATTLHDEHGEFLPISRFIAFGDYKPPAYIYAAALSVKLFGLSEASVRLPSALAGTLLVLLTYFLVKELFIRKDIGLLAAVLVAVSPWSLQMSRVAFEANLATLFSTLGIYFFLRAIRLQKSIFYFLSSIFCVLSLYTFNSHRVFIPIMIFGITLIFWREILKNWQKYLLFAVCCLLFSLPLLPHILSREGSLRFSEVSWVNDLAPLELSNTRISQDGDGLISKMVHNRRAVYFQEFLKHYFDHFKGQFLFFSGDVNPKLSIQTVGELYWLDLPFLLGGIYFLVRNKTKASLVLFLWIFVAPIPAAFARETPHALRTLQILPIPMVVVAFGIVGLLRSVLLKSLVSVLFLISGYLYLHDYYAHYSHAYAMDWQYGYKEMVSYVKSVEKDYDSIQITNKYGRPYIYVLFYEKYSPERYWEERKVDRDWFGFWYVHSFAKYYFDSIPSAGKTLFVREKEGTPPNAKLKKQIVSPKGEVIFNLYEI